MAAAAESSRAAVAGARAAGASTWAPQELQQAEQLARAALEAIGYQIADILDVMRDSAGTPIQSIHADGGPTKNAFIMQFVADMTGVELAVSSVPNCSALGAAMAGMIGTGTLAGINDLAKLPREKAIYKPSMPADQVKSLRAGWQKAVARTLLK